MCDTKVFALKKQKIYLQSRKEVGSDANSYLDSELKLSESFDERHSFNVTNSSAQLDDANFWLDVAFDRLLSDTFDPFLNCISDMWDNCRDKQTIVNKRVKNRIVFNNLELFFLNNSLRALFRSLACKFFLSLCCCRGVVSHRESVHSCPSPNQLPPRRPKRKLHLKKRPEKC